MGYQVATRLTITDVIGPGPAAKHERFAFTPDTQWQVERIAELYARSGRRLSYLGDWHTHPLGRPTPSHRDRETLRTISRYPDARCPQPLMLILGGGDGSWHGQLCRYRNAGRFFGRIEELEWRSE